MLTENYSVNVWGTLDEIFLTNEKKLFMLEFIFGAIIVKILFDWVWMRFYTL